MRKYRINTLLAPIQNVIMLPMDDKSCHYPNPRTTFPHIMNVVRVHRLLTYVKKELKISYYMFYCLQVSKSLCIFATSKG